MLGNYWGQRQGGAELQAHYLELEVQRRGWKVQYCFLSHKNNCETNHTTTLYPIKRRIVWSKLGNIKFPYIHQVLHSLKKMRPDFIYQRGASALTGIAAYYAKKNNCRLVFHIAHDRDVANMRVPFYRPYLYLEKKIAEYGIRNADAVIAQSNFQKGLLEQNYARKDAAVILNWHPVPGNCKKKQNETNILWIANWKPIKQPEIFVQLAKALSSMPNVNFKMIGRTDRYARLAEEAKKAGIEVMGEVSNEKVNDLLDKGHILVNTSLQEGFSNTFIQAWMRKVPVISLQVDPDNIIKDKGLGFCSGRFQQLVKDTKKLIEDSELRQKMGNNARAYAIANHSLNNIDKVLEIIEKA